MALEIKSGATSDVLTVDATSKAARVTLYDALGNEIAQANHTNVSTTQEVLPVAGIDYKTVRAIRVASNGALRVDDDSVFLHDSCEGAAVDTRKWIQTTTTMTITQATGVTTFNAASSVATTVGAMHTSNRTIPYIVRGSMVFRCRARATAHFNNNLIELGFGAPATATTAAVPNGAFWRKDGTGQWVPVVTINSSESLGTPIPDATFTASVGVTEYAMFEVFLEESRATFQILTNAGVIVNRQVVEFGPTSPGFSATHVQAFERIYNSAVVATAVQLLVSGTSVIGLDTFSGRPWQSTLAGMGYGSSTSPTAYTQLATYANSAAPANATLSNTAAGYATLGGLFSFAAVAGAATDYALFALAIPSPYSFYLQRIKIAAWNTGAAVATTPTLMAWGFAVGSSAVSLATAGAYAPMRTPIGAMSFPIGAVIGATSDREVEWTGLEVVQPGRFLHIILRMPVATATASQVIQGCVSVGGYFE